MIPLLNYIPTYPNCDLLWDLLYRGSYALIGVKDGPALAEEAMVAMVALEGTREIYEMVIVYQMGRWLKG